MGTKWLSWLGVGLVISRSLVQFRLGHNLSLGKTVYSILPQSTQLQNGYLALIRQCLELTRYMLPAALEYPSGDWNGFRVYRSARGGRLCEHFGGYKTINRIPLPFTFRMLNILMSTVLLTNAVWIANTYHMKITLLSLKNLYDIYLKGKLMVEFKLTSFLRVDIVWHVSKYLYNKTVHKKTVT